MIGVQLGFFLFPIAFNRLVTHCTDVYSWNSVSLLLSNVRAWRVLLLELSLAHAPGFPLVGMVAVDKSNATAGTNKWGDQWSGDASASCLAYYRLVCVVLEQSMERGCECNLRYHLLDCYTFTPVVSHTCQNNGPFCAGCEHNLKEWMEILTLKNIILRISVYFTI